MQSPDFSQTYFELFGLDPVFDIDHGRLHTEQQRLLASYHPDRYVTASDLDKRVSMQVTSWINQAYEILRDPVKRARYLLEISGVTLPDESTTTSDTAFLMEQIELREEVEACRHSEDAIHCCEQIEAKLKGRADDLAREFMTSFEAKVFDGALLASRKMQFIQRIRHHLDELQLELEDF